MSQLGRQRLSADWQTWLVLICTTIVGRWLASGGFGYTLFVVVWAPIAALWVLPDRPGRTWAASLFGTIALFGLPWAFGHPFSAIWRLTVWLTLFVIVVATVRNTLRFCRLDPIASTAVASLCWLLWVYVPLLMTDPLQLAVGESSLALLLEGNPVLLANASETTAGDWTHQSVAYASLTRLGQDVPFTWGGLQAATFYAVVTLFILVPRGTLDNPTIDSA